MDIQYLRDNNLILLECISGSKAYNLDTPESDTDIKGVFYMPKEKFFGFEYIPQIANSTNDIVFYELGRFLELLSKSNPNILELLATPSDKILYKSKLLEGLKLEDFLSKKCKDTFGGYAITQIKKARGLNKKIVNPIAKEKKTVLDFCYILKDQGSIPLIQWLKENKKTQEKIGLIKIPHFKDTYGLYYDEYNLHSYKGVMQKKYSNSVVLSSIPKGEIPITTLSFNQNGYTTYCKDYKEYWDWVENRNENRFKNNIRHEKNYDSKNMMHTFRLLDMAIEILRFSKINVYRDNREDLLKIKKGELDYETLVELANSKMQILLQAFEESQLPSEPNYQRIEELLVNIRKKLYSE